MLAKMDVLEKPVEVNDEMKIRLEPNIISGNDVLTIRDLGKSFGNNHLFSHVDIDIQRGERVAVIGNNGTGKTTLLKIINQMLPADSGEITLGAKVHIGYYDQEHQVLHMEKTLFDELQDVFKHNKDLSGGELGRVSLAKLMLGNANFLILDEPTNHLDITSKEILEDALNQYTGTVLYVSHDRYFINKTATRILELTGETFISYIGNYDYYLEKREWMNHLHVGSKGAKESAAGAATSHPLASFAALDSSDGKQDWKSHKEEQARIRKRRNELKKTEEEIASLEQRDQEIDRQLMDPEVASDAGKLLEFHQEKEAIGQRLETLYELWEELAQDSEG